MIKYLEKIKEQLKLEEKGPRELYGYVNGYELTVVGKQTITFILNFKADNSVISSALDIFRTTGNSQFANISGSSYGIGGTLNGWTATSAADNFIKKIFATTEYLLRNDVHGKGYCVVCGNKLEENYTTVKLNNGYITVDNDCLGTLNQQIKQSEDEFNAMPNNYLQGAVGAFLGVLIGCAAWVLLYLVGFISGWVAVLAIFLADLFYCKMGGKSNNIKLVIISTMTFVMLMLTCFLAYFVSANIAISANNSNMTAFELIFGDDEIRGAFIYDMVMNAVFSIIGVILMVIYINRKNKQQHNRITN